MCILYHVKTKTCILPVVKIFFLKILNKPYGYVSLEVFFSEESLSVSKMREKEAGIRNCLYYIMLKETVYYQ